MPPPRPPDTGPFIRGDCADDGKVGGTPTDAIVLLEWAFRGGAEPPCLAACDFNVDGRVAGSTADAVLILRYSFLGGGPPPDPFPECGPGAELDILVGCDSQPIDCQ